MMTVKDCGLLFSKLIGWSCSTRMGTWEVTWSGSCQCAGFFSCSRMALLSHVMYKKILFWCFSLSFNALHQFVFSVLVVVLAFLQVRMFKHQSFIFCLVLFNIIWFYKCVHTFLLRCSHTACRIGKIFTLGLYYTVLFHIPCTDHSHYINWLCAIPKSYPWTQT